MPKLEIEVGSKTIQKIQKLASISGQDSATLLVTLGKAIEERLDKELIRSSFALLEELGVDFGHLKMGQQDEVRVHAAQDHMPMEGLEKALRGHIDKEDTPLKETGPAKVGAAKFSDEDISMTEAEDFDPDMGGSLGADESEFERMDSKLDPDEIEKMKPDPSKYSKPSEEQEDSSDDGEEENDEEDESSFYMPDPDEEEDMPVKNKEGEDEGYDDDIMNDIQAEAEDEYDNDAIAAASGSYSDDDFEDDAPRRSPKSGKIGNDAPTGEDGSTPDVLPVDYGFDNITGNDAKAGADFFTKVFSGETGDQSKRFQTRRRRIQQ